MFWNLSSAEVSLRILIFDLDEDFDSKEDLLLYFVAMQQNKKSFAMIILAFRIKNLNF